MEVGEEGDYIIYLSLHCRHQNDSCIKVGSDDSYFNVSLIVRDEVTLRQCPQSTTFEERGELKQIRTEIPLLTSLTPYICIRRGKSTVTSGLHLGRSEVLRSLRHYLRAQSRGHHTSDRLEERGVERGSARRERAIVSQTTIGIVSKATLWKLLKDGMERIWAFPSA